MYKEDRQLATKLLAGEEHAFREFFADYFPRLFRFVLRRVNADEELARDVVQAALAKGVRKLDRYRGDAALFTWFCQIARNELSDHLKRNARQLAGGTTLVEREDDPVTRATLEAMPTDTGLEPDALRQRQELTDVVHATLDYLPPRYAQVLELKYLEELSVDSIAERLGVTAVTVQSLLARARTAFRGAFGALGKNLDTLILNQPIAMARE